MNKFVEVVAVTKIYKNRIGVPSDIRRKLLLEDGDKLIWGINRQGDIIIKKSIEKKFNEYY